MDNMTCGSCKRSKELESTLVMYACKFWGGATPPDDNCPFWISKELAKTPWEFRATGVDDGREGNSRCSE